MIDNIKIYKAINKGSIGMRVMIPRIQTELLQNGYIMFDRVKMQIRIGTIADQKPYKLTKLNKPIAWQKGGYSDINGREMYYEHLKESI